MVLAVEVVEEVVVSGGGGTSSLALSSLRMNSISAAHPQGEAQATDSER